MTKEQLIAAGLTEAQATAVLKIHQDSINGNYIPKATFEAERDKVKALDGQIKDRDKQITDLGAFKGTAEQLTTKVADLEKANKDAKEKFDADLAASNKSAALKFELTGKVIDVDDVIPKLDATKIVFKDGKIESGLTEQLDALKKTKPHYFPTGKPDETTKPLGWLFGNTPPEGTEGGGDKNKPSENLGTQLAKAKVASDTIAAKAAETYFK